MQKIMCKSIACFALSALFLGTAFGGYLRSMKNCCEMTFISNAATGFLLLFAAVFLLVKKRDIPSFLYLDCTAMLVSVVGVCAFFAPQVCFVGMSILPHIVTPVCMTAFYIMFCEPPRTVGSAVRDIATVVVLPSLYYIFMIVFGRVSGNSVYVYFDTNAMSMLELAAVGLLAQFLLAVIASALVLICKRSGGRLRVGSSEKHEA